MKIQAKEILIIILGVLVTFVLTILSENKLSNFGNFDINTLVPLFVLVAAIIYVVYKRIGEIDNELDRVKKEHKHLNEKLKIHEKLIDIISRVMALERRINDKK